MRLILEFQLAPSRLDLFGGVEHLPGDILEELGNVGGRGEEN